MKNIVIIGMMGCGKTTIAKLLSEALNMPMIDIDEYLVEKYQQTIPKMFELSEEYFRERETICCKEVAVYTNHIISTGGGVIKQPENIEALKQNSWIVYIERPIEHIITNIETATRPMLKEGADKLYELYKQRHPLYMKACDFHIINDTTLEETLTKIISAVNE